jgi:thiamine-phosphate pyrophosphorylase
MIASARLRSALRLYGITPDFFEGPADYKQYTAEAAAGGMTAVQYRFKGRRSMPDHHACARAMVETARQYGVLSIINDDPNLARDVGADGVHLGVDDASVAATRLLLGDEAVIGASAPDIATAEEAVEAGASYLGVGAIFDASPSKPDASPSKGPAWLSVFRESDLLRDVPIVAIGGVAPSNALACIHAGADGVASIRGLFGEKRSGVSLDPYERAVAFRSAMSSMGKSKKL